MLVFLDDGFLGFASVFALVSGVLFAFLAGVFFGGAGFASSVFGVLVSVVLFAFLAGVFGVVAGFASVFALVSAVLFAFLAGVFFGGAGFASSAFGVLVSAVLFAGFAFLAGVFFVAALAFLISLESASTRARSFALYFRLRGFVRRRYPQQGHQRPSHFMNISHIWHRR